MELNAKGRHNPNADVRSERRLSRAMQSVVCRVSNEDRVGSLEKQNVEFNIIHSSTIQV